MTRGSKLKMLAYLVLILSATFIMAPVSAMAKKGDNNWWDVECETEISSTHYASMLYCDIPKTLHEIEMNSDRVSVEVIGQSEAGRNLFLATVTNAKDKGKSKKLRKQMIKDPEKALELIEKYDDFSVPVMLNCSIHGGEYPGTDACMQLIEYLAYDESDEVEAILDNIVLLINVVQNPDGRVNGTRNNANDINLNRDFFTQSQPETRATVSVITEWNPMVLLDLHGFVNPMLIEPCTPPHNPNYEYDLYLTWAYQLARAMEAELYYQTDETEVIIPYVDWDFGWDDWPGIYAAMYPIYHGAYGHTLETPHRDIRGVDAHYATVWGMLNFVVANKKEMISDQIEVFRRGFLDLDQEPIPEWLIKETVHDQFNELTEQEFPAAYIIPAGPPYQLSEHQAKTLVDFLLFNDVQVETAKKAFTFNGVDYPKDTYIVWMNQPKRGLANAFLEPGDDLSAIEGLFFYSPPSVWSQALLWGANVQVMEEDMSIDTKPVKETKKIKGDFDKDKNAAAYAFMPTSITAFQAANDLLAQGVSLLRTEAPVASNGDMYGAGMIILLPTEGKGKKHKAKDALKDLEKTAKEAAKTFGLDIFALPEIPEDATVMTKRNIAVYGDGELIVTLDTLGFEYDMLSMDDLNDGAIEEYHVLINRGLRWTDLEPAGQEAMTKWFEEGGDYIGLSYRGRAIQFAIDAGIADVAYESVSGNAIVNIDFDPEDSISAGYPEDGYAFVYYPGWFSSVGENVMVAATYDDDLEFLVSGFWPDWEASGANGMPAIVHETAEIEEMDGVRRDVTLFGLDATFRGHPKGAFPLIGNAILDGLD